MRGRDEEEGQKVSALGIHAEACLLPPFLAIVEAGGSIPLAFPLMLKKERKNSTSAT